MLVGQVAQHGFVIFVHAAREVWIVQVLIPRRLRHVLQNVEPATDRSLAIRRKLPPLWQYVILDVILLIRRQSAPVFQAALNSLLFSRCPLLKVPIVIDRSLLFLRIQVIEISCRFRRTILLIPCAFRRTIRARNDRLARRRPIRITRRVCALLVPRRMLLPLLSLFLSRLVFRRTILAMCRGYSQYANYQRHQPARELESSAHLSLHLLRLLLLRRRIRIACIIIRRL